MSHVSNGQHVVSSIYKSDDNYAVNTRFFQPAPRTEQVLKQQPAGPTFEIKPLLWEFRDYALSPNYCLSSCSSEELQKRIVNALKEEEVDFAIDDRLALGYVCTKRMNSIECRFTIIVSSLLKGCQKTLGDKYVVEIFRDSEESCDPLGWTQLVRKLFSDLGEVVHACHPAVQGRCPLLNAFADDAQSDWITGSAAFENMRLGGLNSTG